MPPANYYQNDSEDNQFAQQVIALALQTDPTEFAERVRSIAPVRTTVPEGYSEVKEVDGGGSSGSSGNAYEYNVVKMIDNVGEGWGNVLTDHLQEQPRKMGLGIGGQRLNFNAQPKALDSHYLGEKNDKKHRMADVLAKIYRLVYRPLHGANGGETGEGYLNWLEKQSYFQIYTYLKTHAGFDASNAGAFATSFMKGVAYLNEAARKSYVCGIEGGLLRWQGKALDTGRLSTVFSGPGWAIWVMSPGKQFYTNSHVKGGFHHSSFFSGEAVVAGGEWKVEGGLITYINGKTGHYQTDLTALASAVLTLKKGGANLRSTKVVWYNQGAPKTGLADEFLISHEDILSNPNNAAFGRTPVEQRAKRSFDFVAGGHRMGRSG